MKWHSGIRIDKIPVTATVGGLIFAVGIVVLAIVGVPEIRDQSLAFFPFQRPGLGVPQSMDLLSDRSDVMLPSVSGMLDPRQFGSLGSVPPRQRAHEFLVQRDGRITELLGSGAAMR